MRRHYLTFAALAILWLIGVVLMLAATSPELSYDEADCVTNVGHSWTSVWTERNPLHEHGPLMLYLTKVGFETLPATLPIETRLRLPITMIGALAPIMAWVVLRYAFATAVEAAWLGAIVLFASVIRLSETNIIGPHHLILVLVLGACGLGYVWLQKPTVARSIALGGLFGLMAATMSYVIPVALIFGGSACLALAPLRLGWRKIRRLLSLAALVVAVAAIVTGLLWPLAVTQNLLWYSFRYFAVIYREKGQTVLLNGVLLPRVGPEAFLSWFVSLELPWLVLASCALVYVLWRGVQRGAQALPYRYLGVFTLGVFATAVTAYVAGARNALLLVGMGCLTIGLAAEGLRPHVSPSVYRTATLMLVALATANMLYQVLAPSHIGYLSTDGFAALVADNKARLAEPADALVAGIPILRFYGDQAGAPVNWRMNYDDTSDPAAQGARYVVLTEFFYDHLPPDHPFQSVVRTWPVVWEQKSPHAFGIRLYQRP